MKLQPDHFKRGPGGSKRREDGVATFILLVLMLIMLSLVMAESAALFHLHREVKMLEQKQIKRLDASQTNSVVVTKPESK
jgi:hypothetical protein